MQFVYLNWNLFVYEIKLIIKYNRKGNENGAKCYFDMAENKSGRIRERTRKTVQGMELSFVNAPEWVLMCKQSAICSLSLVLTVSEVPTLDKCVWIIIGEIHLLKLLLVTLIDYVLVF